MNENAKLTKTAELVTDKDIGSNASPDVISLITPVVRDTETIKSVKIGHLPARLVRCGGCLWWICMA